jgi:hypothetical protein
MANGIYRSSASKGAFSPEERDVYGGRGIFERSIRAQPELQTSFDYSKLDEKYPVRSIAGRVQVEQQRRQKRPFLLEDLEYKKTLLEERAAELGIKKAARDLDLFEVNLNREDMILEQVPLARQKLGQLDPRDPDYLKKRMAVIEEHPLAFEQKQFIDVIDQPLLNRHLRMREAKVETGSEITKEEFEKAAMILRDPQTQKLAKANDAAARVLMLQAEDTVNKYTQQIGFDPETNQFIPSVQPQGEIAGDIEEEEDEMEAAMELLSRRPDLKDEINRRLISVGKPPIP